MGANEKHAAAYHGRTKWRCPYCGDAVDVPDSDFGSAVLAACKGHHAEPHEAHHE